MGLCMYEELMKQWGQSFCSSDRRLSRTVWTLWFMNINTLTHVLYCESLSHSAKLVSRSMNQLISQSLALSLMHSRYLSFLGAHTAIAGNQLREKRCVALNPSGIQTAIVRSLQWLHTVSGRRRGNVSGLKELTAHEVWKPTSQSNLWFFALVYWRPRASSVHILPLAHTTHCSHLKPSRIVQHFPNSLSRKVALANTALQSVCFKTETMSVLVVWIWLVINVWLVFWLHKRIIHDYVASM